MSLNWNIAKVKEQKTLCWIGEGEEVEMRKATEYLLFLTITLGMREITAKNYKKFYARLNMYERLLGSMRSYSIDQHESGDQFYTLAEVEAHIGLTTNASNLTDSAFLRHIAKLHEQRCLRINS